jgi:hypothetical protein
VSAAAQLLIPARFNGPPGTGNGGYTAGLLASQLPGQCVEVTLRIPPPLDSPLRVEHIDTGGVEVYDGARLVATGRPVSPPDLPVPAVSYEEAVAAAAAYPGFVDHPFPTCYVCGPERPDGLRIFPGPLPDGRGTAAPWRVPAGADQLTAWAALDCPGGWAIIGPGRPYVLGRMAAQVMAVPAPGADCVVVGALESSQGRKAQVRSTVYGPDGEVVALAQSTWLAI